MQRRPKQPRAHPAKATIKPSRKPQRPLIVTISIENQSLKVYDANGLFAETRVSTGMRGHSTPLGVFSVIQKNKWHRSNIYSGAPMPSMQRLTWSGIAMHAGVVPGYPASHGCIRMPTGFATEIWKWTRMGARVVITPGEVAPVQFAHPLLMTQKPPPAPPVAAAPELPATIAAEKPALEASTVGLAAVAELRPSVGSPATAAPAAETSGIAGANKTTKLADAATVLSQPAPSGPVLDSGTVDPVALPVALPVSLPAADTAAPPVRRSGPIAVLISRKDGKLYARQNFEPLFDVPITIAPSERLLGTHVFTAEADTANAGAFRWSVLSLPVGARNIGTDQQPGKRRRNAGTIEMTPPKAVDSPTEALDRLTIPADAMTKIAEALTTGSSIIVSDQGLAGSETGQGTDFIVPLR